jgi:hypothetical protein
MAQAISHRPLTAKARVLPRVIPCGICGGQIDTGASFPYTSSVFLCQYHHTVVLHTHISTERWTIGRSSETFTKLYWKATTCSYTPWWRLGVRRYSSYSFLTSALDEGERSASRPGERIPGTHCTGGWAGLRAGLDTEGRGKIRCPAGDRTPIARSSSP